jgi:zinc transport system substrate-binding protein
MNTPPLGTLICLLFVSSVLSGACSAAEGLRVSVSILPQAYFVERVAGSLATVQVMIPKGASPETYEPTPQQLVRLADSQLYVKVGAPDFPVEQKYLRAALDRNRKLAIADMSDGVSLLKEDPHVWTSPAAVRIGARNIAQTLEGLDPAHREVYRRNLGAFLQDIEELDREIRRALDGKKGQAFMVYHPSWGYFAHEYGLIQLAIEEEGKPLSAAHIRKMVDLAKARGIRAILVQKGFDAKGARAIARDIGGKLAETDPLERDWLSGMRQVTALLNQVLRK